MSKNALPRANSNQSESSTTARKARTIGAFAILISAFAAQAFAETTPVRFVPFKDFVENTRSAPANNFVSRAETNIKEPAALEEMRQAIITRYKGVEVSHSFLIGDQHYDCVATNQQPAFRTYGLKSAAQAPPVELIKHQLPAAAGAKSTLARGLEAEQPVDAFGNSTRCEANTVPLRSRP